MTAAAGADPASEQTADTAPLTFGQMSVWRDIDRLPRARWQEANLANTFALPEPVAFHRLRAALTALVEKHESVRTVFDVTDPREPRQRVLPATDYGPVELVSAAGNDVDEAITAFNTRPFDLRTDHTLRVLAIADAAPAADRDATEITRVSFCLHHIAADGWAMGLLWMDLLAMLGIVAEQRPAAPDSLLTIAREQRTSSAWQAKLKATQRHFRTVFSTEVVGFAERDPKHGVQQAALESTTLARAAQQLAEAHKVSPSTVFTAAFLDAVAGYCEPGQIRVGLMTSNRFLQRYQNQVTTMNQLIPITAAGDPGADFGDRLADIQLNTMRAYRIGLFDVDQVTPAALGVAPEQSQLVSLCTFNLMAMTPPEFPADEPAGAEPTLHWEPVFNSIAAGCYLRVYVTTAETIRLRLRTGGLPRETLAGILTATYHRVIRAAA